MRKLIKLFLITTIFLQSCENIKKEKKESVIKNEDSIVVKSNKDHASFIPKKQLKIQHKSCTN